jgi:NAD(P)-dependent dehydrogenase (short-subunit alcohol dehydrogenase family)
VSEAKVREAFCREHGITRYGRVEDVADLVTFIVSSRATWLHGATIDLDGGEISAL